MKYTKHGVRDLDAPTWRYLRFAESHGFIAPESLIATIIAELLAPSMHPDDPAQEWPPIHNKTVATAFIDMPGMVSIGRPIEKFHLAGLEVQIPSEDVLAFADQLTRIKLQHVRGREFFLMTGMFNRCLVLTERNRVRLLEQLRARAAGASERSRVFYATRKTAQQTLKEHNASKGLPADTEGAYQNDHRSLYRPPHGGSA